MDRAPRFREGVRPSTPRPNLVEQSRPRDAAHDGRLMSAVWIERWAAFFVGLGFIAFVSSLLAVALP